MKSKGMSIVKKQPQYRWKARSNVDHGDDDEDEDDYHSPFGSASPSRGSFEIIRRERKGSFGVSPSSTPPHQSYMDHVSQLSHNSNINSSHSNMDHHHHSEGSNWFELDMSGQGLKSVSLEIRNFSHITALYLNNNKLSALPDEIFADLRALTTLDMSFNHLAQLPSSIGKLDQLRRLVLHQNRITELAPEVGRLFKLKELQLEGNPIISPPPAILAQGVPGVVGYLRDRMPTGTPPPERRFISYIEPSMVLPERERIRVLSYNILADGYATGYVCGAYGWVGVYASNTLKYTTQTRPDISAVSLLDQLNCDAPHTLYIYIYTQYTTQSAFRLIARTHALLFSSLLFSHVQ